MTGSLQQRTEDHLQYLALPIRAAYSSSTKLSTLVLQQLFIVRVEFEISKPNYSIVQQLSPVLYRHLSIFISICSSDPTLK